MSPQYDVVRTTAAVLAENARIRPAKVAVIDPDRQITYAELRDRVHRLAGGFASIGVGPGTRVNLMLDNHIDYALSWLALSILGAVEIPVNPAFRGAMLRRLVVDSGAALMVVEDRYLDRLGELGADTPPVVVRGTGGDGPRLADLAGHDPTSESEVDEQTPIAIMYTSGSTGGSKGVVISHGHAYSYADPHRWSAATETDVVLVSLPLFHVGGQWAGLYNSLIAGATAVVLPRFRTPTFWDEVRRYSCTYTILNGAMAEFLNRQPPGPADADNTLRHAMMAPVIAGIDEFVTRFDVAVFAAYGSTEASAPLFAPPGTVVPNGCGWPCDDFDVRLVDEHDRPVAAGTQGRLMVRPKQPWTTMLEYLDEPEATVRNWRNLWFNTGDIMYVDQATGQYIFVDRAKDVIRRRGENIASIEVEQAINAHPAVRESAVVGVDSEVTEQEILAVVACEPGQPVTGAALVDFLATRLPPFMVPRYVHTVDELPRTASGKVSKGTLREQGVPAGCWDRGSARTGRSR